MEFLHAEIENATELLITILYNLSLHGKSPLKGNFYASGRCDTCSCRTCWRALTEAIV